MVMSLIRIGFLLRPLPVVESQLPINHFSLLVAALSPVDLVGGL